MHINLESDYAVRIVHAMTHSNERLGAQALADLSGVSLRFTLKIMGKLAAAGIVVSFKGAHGGYELSRPAKDITLRQVIEAVEGPYRFSRCLDAQYACHCHIESCPYQTVFDEVTRLVTDKLDAVSFADISGGHRPHIDGK